MSPDRPPRAARRLRTGAEAWVAACVPGAALLLCTGVVAALLGAVLDEGARAAVVDALAPLAALLGFVAIVAALAGGWLARAAWRRWGWTAARRAEDLQLARAAEREALQQALDARVADGARRIAAEKARFAALMAELQQSVVVCNLEGRILLCNRHARRLLAARPAAAAGAAPPGLGQPIQAALGAAPVAHALARVRDRLAAGEPHPVTTFIAAAGGGALLRVRLAPVGAAPVAADARAAAAVPALEGFVLLLDDVSAELAEAAAHDRLLDRYTESTRAAIGTLQAAAARWAAPGRDAGDAAPALAVLNDTLASMASQLAALAAASAQGQRTRWPLEPMQGAQLLVAARQAIEAAGGPPAVVQPVDPALWLRVDSFLLLRALRHLAGRLAAEFGVARVELALQPAPPAEGGAPAAPAARLLLGWVGHGVSTETVIAWETDPMTDDGGGAGALSVRDVVERHRGRFDFERDRVRHAAFFVFRLPCADAQPPAPGAGDSRPEFYDFDLFQSRGGPLADRPLGELVCTVFDTETTGLAPADGDEILQIGAVRIVAGKLRADEVFDQLVDPERGIPPAGIAVHGITPARVAGQPTLDRVLPAFHAFAADTVLVAHNAAFDLRFLQLKQARTGLRFDQPVLDTLLLSAACHPNQDLHDLEAIAARLGLAVQGRHTALGDAMLTARVFLKLLPLLAANGIVTLGQALQASERTWYARLQY